MAYRHDPDLEFLDRATHEDLKPLVYLLTHDPEDGETRWTEELKSKLKNVNDYHYRWQDIAGELQCFGANTFITILRAGKGVLYREILCDVCDKCDIVYNKNEINIENIEDRLLAKQFDNIWSHWSENNKKQYATFLKILAPNYTKYNAANLLSTIGISELILKGLVLRGLLGYQLALTTSYLTVSSIMSSGTAVATAGSLSTAAFAGGALSILGPRAIGFLIPPLAIFTPLSLGFAFSGPAYRVTMPACICIASLRKQVALTPREILKLKKFKEIIEKLAKELDFYKASSDKSIAIYLFAKKVSSEFGVYDEDLIKSISFGETDTYTLQKPMIDKLLIEKDIFQALKYATDIGHSNEHLINIIEVIAASADKLDSDELSNLLKKLYLQ